MWEKLPHLIGRFEYAIDPKNRLAVPPRFRQALRADRGRAFILTSGLEACLFLFLPSKWRSLLADNLKAFNLPDKEAERAFKRKFFAEATEVEPDGQGRILIPHYLKDYAGLRQDVLVQGAGTRIEIWDTSRWKSYAQRKAEPVYRKVGKTLEL